MQNKAADSAFDAAMLSIALEKIDELIATPPRPMPPAADNRVQETPPEPTASANAAIDAPRPVVPPFDKAMRR